MRSPYLGLAFLLITSCAQPQTKAQNRLVTPDFTAIPQVVPQPSEVEFVTIEIPQYILDASWPRIRHIQFSAMRTKFKGCVVSSIMGEFSAPFNTNTWKLPIPKDEPIEIMVGLNHDQIYYLGSLSIFDQNGKKIPLEIEEGITNRGGYLLKDRPFERCN